MFFYRHQSLVLKSFISILIVLSPFIKAESCKNHESFELINNYIYDVKNVNKSVDSSYRIFEYHDYSELIESYKEDMPTWSNEKILLMALKSVFKMSPVLASIKSVSHFKVENENGSTQFKYRIELDKGVRWDVDSISITLHSQSKKILGILIYGGESFSESEECKYPLGEFYQG